MVVTRHDRLAASSLLEVVIAMVLMGIVFGISATIIANAGKAGFTQEKFGAMLVADDVANITRQQHSFFDENTTIGGYDVVKIVERYEDSKKLIRLKIEVYNQNGHLLFTRQQLIHAFLND